MQKIIIHIFTIKHAMIIILYIIIPTILQKLSQHHKLLKITETKFFDVILGVFVKAANILLPVKYLPRAAPKMERPKSNPAPRFKS